MPARLSSAVLVGPDLICRDLIGPDLIEIEADDDAMGLSTGLFRDIGIDRVIQPAWKDQHAPGSRLKADLGPVLFAASEKFDRLMPFRSRSC